MRFWAFFLSGILLITSGCMKVGPDFIPPKTDTSVNWSFEDPVLINEPRDLQTWWSVFNDEVLNALIQDARSQNLSLQVAGLRILEARAQLGIATGNLYPQQQQVGASATTIRASENAANTISGDLKYNDLNTNFSAAWEIDFWGKFRRGIEAADAQYLARIADYDDVMVTLTAEVARVYIVIRTLEQRIRLANESADFQERSMEIAENRFEGGLVTELDVQQARTLLANTRAIIPRLSIEYRRAQNALSVLLGKSPQDLSARLETSPQIGIPAPPPEIAIGIPADLLRRRPDIRRAEMQTASQSALIGVAKADLFPHFSLVGSIGLQTSDSDLTRQNGSDFGDLFSSNSLTYFAGPTLTWDILNYGRIKNRVRVEDARLQQLIVNYQNTVLNATREVEDAMIGYLQDQIQAQYLSEAVTASNRSVEISSLQYGEGLTDYQRVLDAQRGLTIDQDTLATTQGNVAIDLVNIYKALGGGWVADPDREYVDPETKKEMKDRTDWGGLLDPEQEEKTKEE